MSFINDNGNDYYVHDDDDNDNNSRNTYDSDRWKKFFRVSF